MKSQLPREFKLLFISGIALTFAIYWFSKSNISIDWGFGLTTLATGIGLIDWIGKKMAEYDAQIKAKIAENDARIDRLEIMVSAQSQQLEQTVPVQRTLLKLEARIAVLQDRLHGE